MPGRWKVEGHAILSADDCIADANGEKPDELDNDADWANFQAAMNRSVAVILGRRSYEADTDRKPRNRVVVSSDPTGLERRDGAWWWNPGGVGLDEMLAKVAPNGGLVGVPGGRGVFDLLLDRGMDEFHLARAHTARLPGGVPVFSGVGDGRTAEDCLAAAGFAAGETADLDRMAHVTLTVWRRS